MIGCPDLDGSVVTGNYKLLQKLKFTRNIVSTTRYRSSTCTTCSTKTKRLPAAALKLHWASRDVTDCHCSVAAVVLQPEGGAVGLGCHCDHNGHCLLLV